MSGYDISRFQPTLDYHYICLACNKLVKDPQECFYCGQLYCNDCVVQKPICKSPDCPSQGKPQQYDKIQGAMLRAYRNLKLQCINPKCKKEVSIVDLDQHQMECCKSKCQNFEVCQEFVLNESQFCSLICKYTDHLFNNAGSRKEQYEILKRYVTELQTQPFQQQIKQKLINQQLPIISGEGGTVFKWDKNKCGQGIQLTMGDTQVFLKESSYIFRTVLGDMPFESGVHYWEIEADSRTENELKIGVYSGNTLNLNAAFCDINQGFAYYGLAQLRNGHTASGSTYGKRFKKDGVLGVCLNMNNGTLSFQLNNEYWGIAFRSDLLKKGPIYAAVALLHCAGCTLKTGRPKPSFME
ncbi:unnamed protein product [Paramecium pentaurelia]|uniref:B30.2/SPRY domain-containing protein n=1 Tax=Paramecium pentaurelia TaxID=43138 RepID=A0A8S1Y0R8_9CILI|nr:unnamed protein product [Paramecium pentaurelia]